MTELDFKVMQIKSLTSDLNTNLKINKPQARIALYLIHQIEGLLQHLGGIINNGT